MANHFFRNIVQNCKQATLLILKKQEKKLSSAQKTKLFFHLLFCDACKQFEKQSTIIDQSLSKTLESQFHQPTQTLSPARKQQIQELVNKEI